MLRAQQARKRGRELPWALLAAAGSFALVAIDFTYGIDFDVEHLSRKHPLAAAGFYYRVALPHLQRQLALVNWHVGAGLAWLALGAYQMLSSAKAARLGVHRLLGWLYLGLGVFVCGSGIWLARAALGGLITQAAVLALAGAWCVTAILSVRHAVLGERILHRRWVVRNFAAAVASGLSRPIMSVLHELFPAEPPSVLFPTAFWSAILLAWFLAEWHLERRGGGRSIWAVWNKALSSARSSRQGRSVPPARTLGAFRQ